MSLSPSPAVVWFRRDLRLADNPALFHALQRHEQVIPLYIHAPDEEAPWQPGAASRWWLHHSLEALDSELQKLGSRLHILRGSSLATLETLSRYYGVESVYWNRLYDPALIDRDTHIKTALMEKGISCHSFNASLLNEPHSIGTAGNTPFKVFSAYWRKCSPGLRDIDEPLPRPQTISSPTAQTELLKVSQLGLMPSINWYDGLADSWKPGEQGAWTLLQEFVCGALDGYKNRRDMPAMPSTSRLSPHLHHGELSPRQLVWSLLSHDQLHPVNERDLEHYLSEVGWREFAYYLIYHFPHTTNQSLDSRFDSAGWIDARPPEVQELLQRWQQGRTGIPIVDAGMRELWHTGFMHNRVRMIVASILTKNLGLHWLEGARWFWDTLVDADLASNTLGWQWTAGCGVDAAPYFRIFSPARQVERFDPQGEYIRRWVPQLENASKAQLINGLVPGSIDDAIADYPPPMLDLATTRKLALARWDAIRAQDRAIA